MSNNHEDLNMSTAKKYESSKKYDSNMKSGPL